MPLEKLIKGFRSFRALNFGRGGIYKDLVDHGQSPEALVIACSDSRNDPALLTQSGPGDLFVVRNVAAVVPPYHPDDQHHGTSSAIEFAVKGLKVKNIVVLGHALCGGVRMLADKKAGKQARAAESEDHAEANPADYEFLSRWMDIGEAARAAVDRQMPADDSPLRTAALEQAVILTSLNNLMTFPWIRDGVESGAIALHGWYFDMVRGRLLGYDFEHGLFTEMKGKAEGFTHKPHAANGCCPWSLDDMVRALLAAEKPAAEKPAAGKAR